MLLIITLLVNVAASTARMLTARAHTRPCPVKTRPAGSMADKSTENVRTASRKKKVPTRSLKKRKNAGGRCIRGWQRSKELIIPHGTVKTYVWRACDQRHGIPSFERKTHEYSARTRVGHGRRRPRQSRQKSRGSVGKTRK